MKVLTTEIARYESMRADLERNHDGEWVVIYKDEFVGTFESFESAGDEAARRFGRGPYLIRKIGAPPQMLPAQILNPKQQ